MVRLSPLLILLVTVMHAGQVGSDQVKFSDSALFYRFGESAVFQIKVEPASEIKDLFLVIHPHAQNVIIEEMEFNSLGEVIFNLDLTHSTIFPFSRVEYWFRAITVTGLEVESSREFFIYEDNTHEWKQLDEERYVVKWRDGDNRFGEAVLKTARDSLHSINTFLPLTAPSSIRIYVYPSARDLQESMLLNPQGWVAGHTDPDINVVLVTITPNQDQMLQMDRQIPHELAHIAIYQITGSSGYDQLPAWLNEGIASLVELTPNADYHLVLEQAKQSGQIIPMENLCSTFPADASNAFLAYAQSASFVKFIYQNFGSGALQTLLNSYKEGIDCLEGTRVISDLSLIQLESLWHKEVLGLNLDAMALQNLIPYLVIGSLILIIPFIISMIKTPPPGEN